MIDCKTYCPPCAQELAKAIASRASLKQAKEKELKDKAIQDEKTQTDALDAAALKRIAHAKSTRIFTADWRAGGHAAITSVKSLDDLKKVLEKDDPRAYA